MLPSSTDIIVALDRIIKVFENTVEVGLVRSRWKEIKRLQSSYSLALANASA
jgi:hypothetical protein